MKLKHLFNSEKGVSPVIGVILMVAITVILAAVIGTFVLGLGQQVSETSPQASIQMELNSTYDELDIIHNGGDTITAKDIAVKKNGGEDLWTEANAVSSKTTLGPGETVTINKTFSEDDTVTLVHEPTGQVIAEATL